jgi:hypothetical protein
MLIPFPAIPDLADKQVLSAEQLNTYASALEWLLGESHAPTSLWPTVSGGPYMGGTTSNSYQPVWIGHMYHHASDVHYRLYADTSYAGHTWYVRVGYYGDDAAWHYGAEHTGTSGEMIDVTMSVGPAMTAGRVYEWRVEAHTPAGHSDCSASAVLYHLAERGSLTGWTAPPAFADGVSDSDELNEVATDLRALHALVSPVNVLAGGETVAQSNGTWRYWGTYAYRYRPAGLSAAVRVNCSNGRHWRWRVLFSDEFADWNTLYTSSTIAGTGRDQVSWAEEIDLPTALAGSGISLSLGAFYGVRIEVQSTDGGTANLLQQVITRYSDQAPAAGWQVPTRYSQGDTTVTPANLNKLSTDLGYLGAGGAEEIWGDTLAVTAWRDPSTWAPLPRCYSGRHRKRWLTYKPIEGSRPVVHYGTGFLLGADLPGYDASKPWQSYDLGQLRMLPAGAAFYVSGADGAFECDSAVVV